MRGAFAGLSGREVLQRVSSPPNSEPHSYWLTALLMSFTQIWALRGAEKFEVVAVGTRLPVHGHFSGYTLFFLTEELERSEQVTR